MALPNSGLLSISQIAAEFNRAMPCSLSDFYGAAPGIPTSGVISISMFYGKSNAFTFDITVNSANPNIRNLATTAGWDGVSPLIVNINAPLINTLNLGTTVFPNGITLNVSAATRIGGISGFGASLAGTISGTGGTALYTRVPVSINNLGVISGGGSGGTAGSGAYVALRGTRAESYDGSGGRGTGFMNTSSLVIVERRAGQESTRADYVGALLGGETRPWVKGGTGGAGGSWGNSGERGSYDYTNGGSYSSSGFTDIAATPAPAGRSVDGIAYITWINQGTLVGPRV